MDLRVQHVAQRLSCHATTRQSLASTASSRVGATTMTRPRRLFALFCASLIGTSCQARENADSSAAAEVSKLSADSLRCVQTDAKRQCVLYGVSIYELIARPLEWHGKRVRVIGFANFHDEENALFASAEDWRRNISANA